MPTTMWTPDELSERIDSLLPYDSMARHELVSEALDVWEERREDARA